MGFLLAGCIVTVPFATRQWPASNLIYAAAGIAAFAEVTTGLLLLRQATFLRQIAGLVLGLGYLLGGLLIVINLLATHTVATRLWLFRVWHGVFVLGVLGYAILLTRRNQRFSLIRFRWQIRIALAGGTAFLVLIMAYLIFRPFPLPAIIHHIDYATRPDVVVNGIEFLVIVTAWYLLLTARRKTVLSVWMTVVACAVAIDIILFVLGTTLFSAGLYVSKLNNFIAATLVFGVIFYRYIRLQGKLVEANRQLAQMALTDALTGLPNRTGLDQTLQQALGRANRSDTRLAVCVIDLDDFKSVNDQFGHDAGDRLLRSFAQRIAGVLRKGEHFARLGGDEFVLVFENLAREQDLARAMARITDTFRQPYVLAQDQSLTINASIGVALSCGETDATDLISVADRALYSSKRQKPNRTQSWTVHGSKTFPAT